MLKSKLLAAFDHGFGTRLDPDSQAGMASLRQIHSAICLRVETAGLSGEADALISNQPALAVSVRTADCFPILLADAANHAVAAIHAGWRGTASRIVIAAIERMRAEFGTDPAHLLAAVGPGIGVCCYEVGEDVARRFGRESSGNIDLAAANRAQLIDAGVSPERIEMFGLCTFCDPAHFHSYRRDQDQAGRMVSYIRSRR